jgi:type I restriction enzyme M protein
MGIVLPEGVLNNSNLQKVRDYVESKAKILLITSIPQDVFIASGATVKPSLLFFKKFTEEEAKEYEEIKEEATKEREEKYQYELKPIVKKLALRGKEAPSKDEKKELRAKKKEIEEKIQKEIKAKIKEQFNYQIPIVEVQKAGISTTGAKIENELIPLQEEFSRYKEANNLWQTQNKEYKYEIKDEKIVRTLDDEEIVL